MNHTLKTCILLLGLTVAAKAKTVTEYFLDTVDSGDGQWPCLFYELNYNSDLTQAVTAKWYATDEDESYWREGVGPFSIDQNKFLVTQWQSTLHPLLLRRHFTLTPEDLLKISIGTVKFTYSYDENPTVWLNGKKLVSATGWNDNNYADKTLVTLQKKWLVEGDNVLCVSLQQGEGGGHIDCGLSVTYNDQNTGLTPLQFSDTDDAAPAYNVWGQPVPEPGSYHGIVVKDGKKTLKQETR